MYYFKKELWAGMQDESTEDECMQTWDRNVEEYWKQFDNLKSRLSKKAISFFTRESIHDGTFISLNVRNEIGSRMLKDMTCSNKKNPTTVEIELISYSDSSKKLYKLRYLNVRKINFDFPTEGPLFYDPGEDIGDIGYHELTSADDEFLRHEYLFDSGTTLLIEFKTFTLSSKKLV